MATSENIYGGNTYVNSSFVFDKVYDNFKDAMDNVTKDEVLLGRYVLIKYCDKLLDWNTRLEIEGLTGPKYSNPTTDEQKYYNNFLEDKEDYQRSYDRIVLQKVWEKGQMSYKEMASLTTTVSNEDIEGIAQDITAIRTFLLDEDNGTPTIDTLKEIQGELAKVNQEFATAAGQKTPEGGEVFNDYENNQASGYYSHAEGYRTQATGNRSHAEGLYTIAEGIAAHAEGSGWMNSDTGEIIYTTAAGAHSHAEGYITRATGLNSHAEGYGVVAAGEASHAQGFKTYAIGTYSDTSGYSGKELSYFSLNTNSPSEEIEQAWVNANKDNAFTAALGYGSHSEGRNTLSYGRAAHSEGRGSYAKGEYSHAEGNRGNAFQIGCHAEGENTQAGKRPEDVVEGDTNPGKYAHAEGSNTKALGNYSHAGGRSSEAQGIASFAHGQSVVASADNQAVFGKWNKENADALLIVGNGTGTYKKKNVFEVLSDGRATIGKGPINNADVVDLLTLKTHVSDTISQLQKTLSTQFVAKDQVVSGIGNDYTYDSIYIPNVEAVKNFVNTKLSTLDFSSGNLTIGADPDNLSLTANGNIVAKGSVQAESFLNSKGEALNIGVFDSNFSTTSTNGLQNKVITTKFNAIDDSINNTHERISMCPQFAEVDNKINNALADYIQYGEESPENIELPETCRFYVRIK